MSGENQYISPIIDAFLRRRQQDIQTNQESQANQQRQASIENENKYREDLIKESGARLDEAHRKAVADEELRQQQHENASLATKAAIQQHIADAVRNAPEGEGQGDLAAINKIRALGGQGILKGSNPITLGGVQLPGSPTTQLTMPTGEKFGIEGMPTGSQYAEQKGREALQASQGKSQGALPAQEELDAQKALERHTDIATKTAAGIEQAVKVAELHGKSAAEVAKIRSDAMIRAAGVHNTGLVQHAQIMMGEDPTLTPQQAGIRAEKNSNNFWSILDGQDPKLSKGENMGVASFAHDIGSEVPGKHIGEIVNAYKQVGPMLDQAEELAKQYSRDSPKNSILPNGIVANLTGSKMGKLLNEGQDADAAIKQYNTRAALLANANDPKARLVTSVLASQVNGLIDPTKDYATNHKAIENSKKLASQTFNQSISGFPDSVGTALKARTGILAMEQGMEAKKPSVAPINPATAPKGGMPLSGGAPGHVNWPNATKAKGYNIYGSGPEPNNWQDYQNQFPPPPSQSPTAVQPQNPQVAQ
jgi:hypothetical protein